MTNPRKPLRLNVGFLITGAIGISRDFEFDYDKMPVGEDVTLTNFSGTARISRTPQGLLVQGNFKGEIPQECVRCLSEYSEHLAFEFTELYAFTKDNITDSGLLVPEDAHLDLAPLIHDYALLEVPISPLCKPGCKGLCTECGENLNEIDCGHQQNKNDSPFSALKDFLN